MLLFLLLLLFVVVVVVAVAVAVVVVVVVVVVHLINLDEFSAFSKAQLNGTLTSTGAGEKALKAVIQSGEKLRDVQGSVKMTPQFPIMVICTL